MQREREERKKGRQELRKDTRPYGTLLQQKKANTNT